MQIDQSLIYIVIILFTTLTVLIVGIVFAYLKLVKNYMDVKEGKGKYPDPKELLMRAHAKSQMIIEDATDKANQIISSSESLKTKSLDDIQKQIDKIQSNNLKIYQSHQDLKSENQSQ